MSNESGKIINYKKFLENSSRTAVKAGIWRWPEIEAELDKAAKQDPLEPGRWAVSFINGSAGDAQGIAPSVNMLVQVFEPGTHAKRHRHSNFAIFIVKAGDGYTILDGEKITWKTGDVFFAPAWAQHEHCNTSTTERAVLYTVQDVPTMARAGTWFFQGSEGEGLKHNLRAENKA